MWGYPGSLQVRAIFVWPWNENARTIQKQQTNGNRAIWLVYRTDTNARGFWLVKRTLGWKNFMPENFQEINRYVLLRHDWPIEQYLLYIRVFFGGKTKRPCFHLFIHWLIKQITNTYWKHFSRSYENRSGHHLQKSSWKSGRKVNGTWLFGSLQRDIWKGSPVFPERIFQARAFTLYTISHSRFCSAMNEPSSPQNRHSDVEKNIPLFLRKKNAKRQAGLNELRQTVLSK